MHLKSFTAILTLFLQGYSADTLLWSKSVDLADATIEDINKAFDAGTLNSEQLVQMYLSRIEAYDQSGPAINAMIFVEPNALEIARNLDKELSLIHI